MVNHRTFMAAVGIATALTASGYAASDASIPLAILAQRMGLTYAYLDSDDAVSLIGHGMSVTVRPGSPFFYVNDREEPIAGMTPTYESGDVHVSKAFGSQLMTLERTLGKTTSPHRTIAQLPVRAMTAPAIERHVTEMTLSGVKGNDDVVVEGNATPNSLVSLVLKAIAAPELPTVFLNRSFTVASAQGTFKLEISTAPAYYTGTTYEAEAVGVDDQNPVVATFVPPPISARWKALKD